MGFRGTVIIVEMNEILNCGTSFQASLRDRINTNQCTRTALKSHRNQCFTIDQEF